MMEVEDTGEGVKGNNRKNDGGGGYRRGGQR